MTEAAGSRRRIAMAVVCAAVVLGAVATIVVWDPVGSVVRSVGLTGPPDVPRWLLWVVGKVKFVVIAAVVLLAAVRELRRRHGA